MQVQTHKITKRLLSKQSLSLHVDLTDRLTRQTFTLNNFTPFTQSKFHQGQFKNLYLLWFPTWRQSIVPQTFRLVMLNFTLRHWIKSIIWRENQNIEIELKIKRRDLLFYQGGFRVLFIMEGGFGKAYSQFGVTKFYEKTGEQYSNPHRYDIERLLKKKLSPNNVFLKANDRILDLACGSGQITLPLRQMGYNNISGIDPYTHTKYQEMTGLNCGQQSFVDILNGAIDDRRYDAIVVSYALHLVKESMLNSFCHKLAQLSKKLIIISPHKFPLMKETFGWKQIENSVMDRIHFRVYTSLEYEQLPEEQVQQTKQ